MTTMSAELTIDFSQRQNLPDLEEKVLDFWDDIKAFDRSVKERPADKPYIFYDGPPFVTGSPHYGSLLGSITKDIIPRFWTMQGYRVERRWGWDCHGLPIENMIEQELGIKDGKRGIERLGVANFNNACRAAIAEFDATWEIIIRRIGRWVDFKNSYKTMDFDFMESVWWGFQKLHQKGHIYEGRKVILYCPRCATPLSNFEIAMDNSYVDVTEVANTYKYAVKGQDRTFLLAWSTTPWNKLATPALAVNPDLTYVKVEQGDAFYILAQTRLDHLKDQPYTVIDSFPGKQLTSLEFELHYDFYPEREGRRAGVIVADEFVTADTGTGVVTLAIYGEDDYRVMQENNLQLVEHVDEEGKLKPEVKPWSGLGILESNPLVNADLAQRGLVYREEPHVHSVATCYRCHTRLYYAPLPAWFINVQQLKPQLLADNEKINWYPAYLKHGRFAKGIESAPDWNISRSRYWGTPMPVWRAANGQQRIIGSVTELQEWAVEPEQAANLTDIHREFVDDIEVWVDDQRTRKGRRIKEVFDCWVESSSMPFAADHYPFANQAKFEQSYPAQFISEYINQTRAWFYTMHVISVALFGAPAYLNAHNTGIILAEDGSKMSKSKKNYPDPVELLNRDGADALRLYLAASPVMKAENLAFVADDVSNMRKRVLGIWWNVFLFYHNYRPANWQPQTPQPQHVMDRWVLALLEQAKAEITAAFTSYDVSTAARAIMTLINEISTWYLRQSRDRLRQEGDHACWDTFHYVLTQLALLAAPIVPFLSETTYQHLTPESDSVHLANWPQTISTYLDADLLTAMATIRPIVEQGHAQRKTAGLKVRQPLASLSVKSMMPAPNPDVLAIAAQELNVKVIDWRVIDEANLAEINLDTRLTPELEAEGKAREIVRTVQQLRADQNVPLTANIELTLPEWPQEYEGYIKQKTRAVRISKGETSLLVP